MNLSSGDRPELLAPAGDWDCVRAAVENGADAIYLGLDDGFNARARATNFVLDRIPELMQFLHQRGVKGYITLNTLAFSDELPQVERIARQLAAADVDAVLVQDLGVARLIKQACPDLTLHASTQMTLTSAECITVAEELGIERVVLAREMSIDEIRDIGRKTTMPLETFIHGALCVAYSGQCLTSESLGGRSANRGQCAQACRLPYELVCDGELQDLGDQQYLLSPQDLAAFDLTEQLIEAGVCSFKIEGRLKSPEYVANITRNYRLAIDAAAEGKPLRFSRRQVQQMEQSFSRGFSPGWLNGCDHKMLVPATSSSKRGVLLGDVVQVVGGRVHVRLQYSIAAGDGIVFEGDRAMGSEQGGRVFEVFRRGVLQSQAIDDGIVELAFDRRAVDTSKLHPGLKIWKTDDPKLNQSLRRTFDHADPTRKVDLFLTVTAIAGQPLMISGHTSTGCRCDVASEDVLQVARKHPVTTDVLQQQLDRLGGTIYQLASLQATIQGEPMVPLSVLGKLRKQLTEQLDASLPVPTQRLAEPDRLAAMRLQLPDRQISSDSVCLSILVRSLSQLTSLLSSLQELSGQTPAREMNGDPSVASTPKIQFEAIVDFADIREYREAITRARAANVRLLIATPRIQKPDEMGIFRMMLKQWPDGVLVRNLSGMKFFHENSVPVAGDFSLNVTNELSAEFLMQRGLQRVTASYDMNRDQLLDLVKVVPPQWLEVVIHQHMPMFHMEHCVFCSVLSPGTNKTNCGRPCDVHQVELRDRLGIDHPLTADVGCRNSLFNAVPQSSAEIVHELLANGVRHFRVELLREDDIALASVLRLYVNLLAGKISGREVWKALNATNQVGVTRGTLEPDRNPLAIL